MFDPSVFSKYTAPQSLPQNDPYAALRGIPSPVIQMPEEVQKLEPKEEHEQEENKDFVFSEDDDEEDWQGMIIFFIQKKSIVTYFIRILFLFFNR